MTSTKPSTMSKIWVCKGHHAGNFSYDDSSPCGMKRSYPEEYDDSCNIVPHIPVSAVIEMIEERLKYLYSQVTKYPNRIDIANQYDSAAHELESLKKQIEGEK